MKKLLTLCVSIIIILSGCQQQVVSSRSGKVGLLVPTTISDPVWGSKGYNGLLKIQSELNTDVYYKEEVNTKAKVQDALDDFVEKGVTLVFGHGKEYELFFKDVHNDYPTIQFVYFNGDYSADNVLNIKFDGYATGFFAGMVASKMSEMGKLGIIAAFEWQREVTGFVDGAHYQNPKTDVKIEYTHDWDDVKKAKAIYKRMRKENVDIFYPAGDGFNAPIIQNVKNNDLYAIGFISDQSYLGEQTVLTSTIQHIDQVYEAVAKSFMDNSELPNTISYDMQNEFITMGPFSPQIPKEFQDYITEQMKAYIKTGSLPAK